MDHIIRYICILEQMPIAPKPSISTKDMLEKLEEKGFSVTLRSLQRDLAALAKYYPIICNNKVRPNRWCFTEDYQGSFASMDVPSAVSTILVNEYLQSIIKLFPRNQPIYLAKEVFFDTRYNRKLRMIVHTA